jgi:penicillin-binding protein 1A
LGVADLSIYEMVPAYNTFNNMGTYTQPVLITRVTDKFGRELKRFVSTSHVVMNEAKDYTMIQFLKGVTSAELNGTAAGLRSKFGLKGPMGGKTGTTQSNGDGWFMGIIPQLTGGIWVGGDESKIHSRNMTGGTSAAPIWGYFLQRVYADRSIGIDPDRDWPKPSGEVMEWDCDKFSSPIPPPGE